MKIRTDAVIDLAAWSVSLKPPTIAAFSTTFHTKQEFNQSNLI
jgi:hypothetical protein